MKSILTATYQDFCDLYHFLSPDSYSEESFANECIEKQRVALEDCETLRPYNVTPKAIGALLNRIVITTNSAYNCAPANESKRPVLNIRVEGKSFTVSGFDITAMGEDACLWCAHVIQAPTVYHIQNPVTKETLKVAEMSLHTLKRHEEFSRYSSDPIDPVKALQVLGYRV